MNQPYLYYPTPDPLAEEKRILRRGAQFTGTTMLFLILFTQTVMTVLVLILMAAGVLSAEALSSETLGLGNTAYLLLYLPVYVSAMGLPMLLGWAIFKPKFRPMELSGRVSGGVFAACVLIGLGVCTGANFIASIWATLFQSFGVEAPTMPKLMDNTVLSVALNLVIFALLPALLEEFLFRGYVLQALRPYGSTFAIVVSALLFGLMHCNLTQLPFAFMLGLAFGYFTLRLNNIWVSCTIHFLNNAIAVLLNDLLPYYVENELWQGMIVLIVFGLLFVVGVTLLIALLAIRHPLFARQKTVSPVSCGERMRLCFTAPTLLIAIVLFVVLTALNTV